MEQLFMVVIGRRIRKDASLDPLRVATPARNESRRRYMRPTHAASAMRGYSRQTDLNQRFTLKVLPRRPHFVCHFEVTGSNVLKTLYVPAISPTPKRHNRAWF